MTVYSVGPVTVTEKRIYIHPDFMAKFRELVSAQKGDCKNDHGERSNRKLRDQPFYQRGRNNKMKRF